MEVVLGEPMWTGKGSAVSDVHENTAYSKDHYAPFSTTATKEIF
jgi:hypothetical protein